MCKMCPTIYIYMIILINKDKYITYKNKRERERRVKKAKETYKERKKET